MIDTIRLKVSDKFLFDALQEYKNVNFDNTKKAYVRLSGLKERLMSGEVLELSMNDVKDINNMDKDLLVRLYEKGIDIDFLDYFQMQGLGSWNRNVNIFLDSLNQSVFMEFSLNKMIFGHNLYNYEDCLFHLFNFLNEFYGRFDLSFSLEDFYDIELYRLDLAYNYRFDYDIVQYIKSIFAKEGRYKRKKVHFYNSSLMLVGSAYSLKLYNKHEEFKKHDFKSLRNSLESVPREKIIKSFGFHVFNGKEINVSDTDKHVILSKVLQSLLEYSAYIYRFELTIRRKKLQYDNILTLKDLDSLDLIGYYEEFLEGFGMMEVKRYKMEDLYNKIDDVNLLSFVTFVKQFGLESAKQRYKKRTFYYYKKKLKDKYNIDVHLLNFEEDKVINFKPASSSVPLAVAV